MSLLDKYAPKEQKYIQANNANFMTKSLKKATMLRSKFRNRFLKEKTEESKSLYQGVHLTLTPRIVSVQVKDITGQRWRV